MPWKMCVDVPSDESYLLGSWSYVTLLIEDRDLLWWCDPELHGGCGLPSITESF